MVKNLENQGFAPVPTSGAAEVAREIWGLIDSLTPHTKMLSINGQSAEQFQAKAAAIIQQYGDARCVEGRRDQEQFHLEEMASQPPAADGKLEKLRRRAFEGIEPMHYEALCFTEAENGAVGFWGVVETQEQWNKAARECAFWVKADDLEVALAQPASDKNQ